MKRFMSIALVAGLVLGAGSMAFANICAFDPVPAATLLFPFVALDLDLAGGSAGTNTLFAITNVSREAVIAHVTVWNERSRAILDFNVVLSGYDVQTMSIRDIVQLGELPKTGNRFSTVTNEDYVVDGMYASPALGPVQIMDLPAPYGTDSLFVRTFQGETHSFYYRTLDQNEGGHPRALSDPVNYDHPLSPDVINIIQNGLMEAQAATKAHRSCPGTTTEFVTPSWWPARSTADTMWMYITVDVTWTVNRLFPDADDTYYNNELMYDNVLTGDVFWVNPTLGQSEADKCVHIEADVDLGEVVVLDGADFPLSFYHRYVVATNAATSDFREPLPTAWAFRYISSFTDPNAPGTYIRAWKGGTFYPTTQEAGQLQVGGDWFISGGTWYADDCEIYTYYAWDEDENVFTTQGGGGPSYELPPPGSFPNLLPMETQEVALSQFKIPADFGWMLFVWPFSSLYQVDDENYQTWVGVRYEPFGNYSMALSGTVMANWACFPEQVLPGLGINYNYVDFREGGYTDAGTNFPYKYEDDGIAP